MTSQYVLSCHCQAHVYLLNLPSGELEKGGVVCDCSWCIRRRFIWAFVPHDTLTLHRGAGKDGAQELAEYRFGEKVAAHKFCGKCGTYLIMEPNRPGEDRWFINLRAIRNGDFDIWKLPLTIDNSAGSGPPFYDEITLSDVPGVQEGLSVKAKEMGGETEIYTGNCHCKAVKFAVVCKSLHSAADERMVDCACSICLGNGALWLYPFPDQVIFHPSDPSNPHKPLSDTVVRYTFASGGNVHYVCKTCGCHIYEHREATEGTTMGLNLALFSRAGEWSRDIHGIGEGTEQVGMGEGLYKVLKGLKKDDEDRGIEPKYEVRL